MTTTITKCLIWGEEYRAEGYYKPQNRVFYVEDSPRAAGGFVVPEPLVNSDVKGMTEEQKARLTTWLIDQRNQGSEQPTITSNIIDHVKTKRPLGVRERATRLLRFIAGLANAIGETVTVSGSTHGAYAWSESTTWGEIEFLVRYLDETGWTEIRHFLGPSCQVTVTVAGHSQIAEQATNFDSSQSFIAMWFHESTAEAFEKGIKPAVEEAGYEPLRIDQKEHINKIDDEIIAEIRRSRFLIADFTQGEDGARGGVYYEAGFAHGLDIPVIFTCRLDTVESLHFDTNHYNHIVWENPEDLREKLRNRILAVIGEGPEINSKL